MHVDLTVETTLKRTPRVQMLEGMFDVPAVEKLSRTWTGDIPIETRPWNIGLIVGPSGAGKSSVMRQMFGERKPFVWKAKSIVDDFDAKAPMEQIAQACSAVGFNTIPSWTKPFDVLSTGEKFRVDLARHLVEDADPIVIDEFTSVIDRQVAHIGSHAVQKYIRKHNRKFVAVTCHYDVIEWLQPDWMLEPATMTFQWRSVQRRPDIAVEIARVDHSAWKIFAPFHYLTSELHRAAQCFVLFVEGVPASFIGIINVPHEIRENLRAISRSVTLPDYQGMGFVMALESKVCGAYKAFGIDVRGYPAHPSHVRSLDRSPEWKLIKPPGKFSGVTTSRKERGKTGGGNFNYGGRPCAVFEFCGKPLDRDQAAQLLGRE